MKKIAFLIAMLAGTPALAQVTADTPNPMAGNPAAVETGGAVFGKFNCAGCHAYDLTGGMGPDLTDTTWIYGGKPGEIFHSIAEGTPRGMPPWKDRMTTDEIWQVITYIQSKHQ